MKNIYLKTAIILCMSCKPLVAEKLGLPSRASLEERAKARGVLRDGPVTGGLEFDESDFQWPAKGLLRKADLKVLGRLREDIDHGLRTAPEASRRASPAVVGALQTFNGGLGKVVASGRQTDFFPLIPQLVDFEERVMEEAVDLGPELALAAARMLECGTYVVRAYAYHIVHEQGVVSVERLRLAVPLFCNDRLLDETAWDEGDLIPVDSGGILILNPELVAEEVKRQPLIRVHRFLRNITDPADVFQSYAAGGDGLEVLKARYAANKEVIDTKYRELVTWWRAKGGSEEGGGR
jgi:hypothetical protein